MGQRSKVAKGLHLAEIEVLLLAQLDGEVAPLEGRGAREHVKRGSARRCTREGGAQLIVGRNGAVAHADVKVSEPG